MEFIENREVEVCNSFKINSLEIYDGFLAGLKIIFSKEKELNSKIFNSIIIGENGVGKSIVLRIIVDAFLELEKLKYKKKRIGSSIDGVNSYKLEYSIEKNEYCLVKKNNKTKIFLNGIELNDLNILKLPQTVIACSFLVNDKFIFTKKSNDSLYKYMGVRIQNTMTNTSLVAKQIASNIMKSIEKDRFISGIKECFDFLNIKTELKIVYRVKRKDLFFWGDVTTENIFEKFDRLWSKRSTIIKRFQ